MTDNMLMGTLNPTHSLTHSLTRQTLFLAKLKNANANFKNIFG